VDVNSTNATPPYTNWTTAATNIQDAVDAAVAGDEVVVTNGIYATGGRPVAPSPYGETTRVVVDRRSTLRSVNGARFTAIDGNGSNRCVYLSDGANLSGFTLTNGLAYDRGGGLFCETTNTFVSNCLLTRNRVGFMDGHEVYGGGAYGGTLNNCALNGNVVRAVDCTLNQCIANSFGGGAYGATLNNCTLTGNSAQHYPSGPGLTGRGYGGGTVACTLNNCIAFQNYTDFGSPCEDCEVPGRLVNGSNWVGDPLFVDLAGGDLRLQSNSPCINAGNNAFALTGSDPDGNPRIKGGTVDMGAYEYQSPASMISYAWLQQFNLPINPATDTADPDGDGVNNYHEWLAGSDPTNPFSFPPLLTLIPYGANVVLTWPTNAVGFTLQSTTNLGSPSVWSTNAPAPIVIGNQNVAIAPLSRPQQFYRLVH
jgi:hypothetical protein